MFSRLGVALARCYDVVAVDPPGSGESARLAPGTSIEAIAQAIGTLSKSLWDRPPHVYGIHTGNKIGAYLAAREAAATFVCAGQTHSLVMDQQRRNSVIRHAASAALRDSAADLPPAMAEWIEAVRHLQSNALNRTSLTTIGEAGEYQDASDQAVDELQGWAARKALYAANFAFDFGDALKRIVVPTLILEFATPAEDRVIGRQAPALIDALQKATAVELHEPDGIGFTMEHRADEIADIVDRFISGHARQTGRL